MKQRILYLIGEYGPIMESLVGGNFNGLAIPPTGVVRLQVHDAMHGMSEENEERLEELGPLVLPSGQ